MLKAKSRFTLTSLSALGLLAITLSCNFPSNGFTPTTTATPMQGVNPTLSTGTPGGAVSTPLTPEAGPSTPIMQPGDEAYQDNRSGPAELIQSMVNAINMRQYVRAYSYWDAEIAKAVLQPYPEFEKGYADTANIQLTLGAIGSDVGAGQLYYAVPVTLISTRTDGSHETFVGCYQLHLANPGIQDSIPFHPLDIEAAEIVPVPADSDPAARMAHACQNLRQSPDTQSPTPPFDPADIGAARYLDDRSSPTQLLRSLFNAVNRREYARAYSYWAYENPDTGLPSYEAFKKGYADTDSVQLIAGTATVGAAAGNRYYKLPVVLIARTTGGETQTYFGCYQLHLSDPQIQGVPPFNPLKIESANLQSVPNDSNPTALLAQGCPQP